MDVLNLSTLYARRVANCLGQTTLRPNFDPEEQSDKGRGSRTPSVWRVQSNALQCRSSEGIVGAAAAVVAMALAGRRGEKPITFSGC